jgi:hypothetical protein
MIRAQFVGSVAVRRVGYVDILLKIKQRCEPVE